MYILLRNVKCSVKCFAELTANIKTWKNVFVKNLTSLYIYIYECREFSNATIVKDFLQNIINLSLIFMQYVTGLQNRWYRKIWHY